MLETIRQFAEEQLVARGEASEIRAAHSRYFAGREADILALWDSPRQREAYDWFTVELANLRTAFRWAADQGDLDVAATIATYAGWLGVLVQTLEPIAWAEELIEPARAVDHPRLAFLYVIGVAVLHDRTDRGGCRLLRSRPDRSRREPRCAAVRHRRHAWNVIPGHRAARAVGRVVPRPARTPPRHPRLHPGMARFCVDGGGFRWGGDGLPRMASSRLRRQQATRPCSRGRSLPTVWLSVTRILSGRLTPSAGVW